MRHLHCIDPTYSSDISGKIICPERLVQLPSETLQIVTHAISDTTLCRALTDSSDHEFAERIESLRAMIIGMESWQAKALLHKVTVLQAALLVIVGGEPIIQLLPAPRKSAVEAATVQLQNQQVLQRPQWETALRHIYRHLHTIRQQNDMPTQEMLSKLRTMIAITSILMDEVTFVQKLKTFSVDTLKAVAWLCIQDGKHQEDLLKLSLSELQCRTPGILWYPWPEYNARASHLQDALDALK